MANSKITVLFNEITSLPFADKKAVLCEEGGREDARLVARALLSSGYKSDVFELTPQTVQQINKVKTDLFFNLCDGIGNLVKTEHKVPEILDNFHLPYTGANSSALILTTNKALTKKVFEQNGIPTPGYAVLETVPEFLPPRLEFPLFAKPVAEDCSLGITPDSMIVNMSELKREVRRLLSKYNQPVLIEEYIAGKELNVTVMGNGDSAAVLPISEIVFGKFYLGKPKFVDFKAKWLETSLSYRHTNGVCPAQIDDRLRKKIEKLALRAYFACGGRDYARIDIRLSRGGVPYFLEVNLNPDLSPDMGASRSAKAFGLSYSQFIGKIASVAAKRYD